MTDNNQETADLPTNQEADTVNLLGVDVKTEVNNSLEKLDFAAQFERDTGHKNVASFLDANKAEKEELSNRVALFKGKFKDAAIKTAILTGSKSAVSPEFMVNVLTNMAECNEEGDVSIQGKPAHEFINEYLTDNPFLVKPSGNNGSGAPTSSLTTRKETISRSSFDKMTGSERTSFLNSGGKVTD